MIFNESPLLIIQGGIFVRYIFMKHFVYLRKLSFLGRCRKMTIGVEVGVEGQEKSEK